MSNHNIFVIIASVSSKWNAARYNRKSEIQDGGRQNGSHYFSAYTWDCLTFGQKRCCVAFSKQTKLAQTTLPINIRNLWRTFLLWIMECTSFHDSIYRVAKKVSRTFLSISSPNFERFSFFFSGIFRRKFVLKCLLHIPPHLNCVATLPC